MLKIRRPLGRLIFNMGIAIPGKTVFLIETAPRIFDAIWRHYATMRWLFSYTFFGQNINIYLHFISFLHTKMSNEVANPSLWMATFLSYAFNTIRAFMTADDLTTQGARSYAAVILTQIAVNPLVVANVSHWTVSIMFCLQCSVCGPISKTTLDYHYFNTHGTTPKCNSLKIHMFSIKKLFLNISSAISSQTRSKSDELIGPGDACKCMGRLYPRQTFIQKSMLLYFQLDA